jgi:hypothetical protein
MGRVVSDEGVLRDLDQPTLAEWRSQLVKLRGEERQRAVALSAETGRLLEIVGQALAQGGGALPPADVARLEELTGVRAAYRALDG